MGEISEDARSVYRRYATDGVASSGTHRPEKAAIIDLFETIDEQLAAALVSQRPFLQRVRALVTTNVNLSSDAEDGDSFGGVTLATGDRIAKAYNGASGDATNGIYIVQASGAAVRATDADASAELIGGRFEVTGGTYEGTIWSIQNTATISVGSTPIVIVDTGEVAEMTSEVGAAVDDATYLDGGPRQMRVDSSDRPGGVTTYGNGMVGLLLDYRDAANNATQMGVATADGVDHTAFNGQSNIEGYLRTTILTPRPIMPATCWHLSDGPHSPHNAVWDGEDANAFIAAKEARSGDYGEGAGGSAMMRWLHYKVNADRYQPRGFLVTNASYGGRTIEELAKGSAYNSYANGMKKIERANLLSQLLYDGIPHRVIFEVFNQGESASASSGDWATALATRLTNLDADIKAITGQSEDVRIILVQTSADESSTTVPNSYAGQVSARDADPDHVAICSPRYWVDLGDNTHYVNESDIFMQEYYALCQWNWYYKASPSNETSLRVVKHTRSGAVHTLRLRKPPGAGNVYLETTLLPANTDSGFSARDGGSADTISNIAAIDNTSGTDGGTAYDATITITLDGTPGGTSLIRYAKDLGTTGQNRPASWGNVACHSDEYSLYDPTRELVYWLEIYEGSA